MPPIQLRFHGLSMDEETIEPADGTTFEDLLRERDIHPETVLVFCNDQVVPHEQTVPAGAEVRVMRIISGG